MRLGRFIRTLELLLVLASAGVVAGCSGEQTSSGGAQGTGAAVKEDRKSAQQERLKEKNNRGSGKSGETRRER